MLVSSSARQLRRHCEYVPNWCVCVCVCVWVGECVTSHPAVPLSGKRKWVWSGCSDHVAYGESVAAKFLDFLVKKGNDAWAYTSLHNNRAGRLVSSSDPVNFTPVTFSPSVAHISIAAPRRAAHRG